MGGDGCGKKREKWKRKREREMVKQQNNRKAGGKGGNTNKPEKKRGMIKEKDRASAKPLLKKRHSLRAKRRLEKKMPQVVEPVKTAMFLKGTKSSSELIQVFFSFFLSFFFYFLSVFFFFFFFFCF